MENKSKESKYPCINCDVQTKWWQLTIKDSEADLVLFVLSAEIFPQSTVTFFLAIYSCFQGKRNESWLHWIYIYLYIFTTDPLDLNIQINTKTTKIALYCRNGVGFQDTCPSRHASQWKLITRHFKSVASPWCCFEWHICWAIQHLWVIKKIFLDFIYS